MNRYHTKKQQQTVSMWTGKSAQRALNKWKPLGRHRAAVRIALKALLHRELVRAKNAWHEQVAFRKHVMRAIRLGGAAFTKRKLRMGYNSWAEVAAAAKAYERALRLRERHSQTCKGFKGQDEGALLRSQGAEASYPNGCLGLERRG